MATVELEHVTVRRSGLTVLDDVNVAVADGELIGVIGGSGAGKTTLLRVIAGLEPVAAGTIRIDGVDVTDTTPADRNVSMVFQTPALLPHRDVLGNIEFPLEIHHEQANEIATRVAAETRALHIEALLARLPHGLSAGEAQLVQIARAMVRLPSVLLLDEPLARLDATLAQHMRLELRSLQQGYGLTAFLATNDPVEAMSLPDRLVVVDAGHVVQVDTPIEVYGRPASLVAAACTGEVSTLTTEVEADGSGFWLVHAGFRRRAWHQSLAQYVGARVVMAMRPTWMHLTVDGPLRATVTEASPGAGMITVEPDAEAAPDRVVISTASPAYRRGNRVSFEIDELALFDPVTGNAISQ
jgi:ABC-type sugar transport system ATPase subunit